MSKNAQILIWGSPPILQSGLNCSLIVAVALRCSLAARIVLVLILERADIPERIPIPAQEIRIRSPFEVTAPVLNKIELRKLTKGSAK